MMTTKSISSPKMFIRLIAAALICLAPLTVSADPNPADLARKAASLARLAVAEEDPKAAVVGAFEAHNLWNRAFQTDGNELHLCNARSLLAKICARSDLETEHRVALEASRKALPKCPKSADPEKHSKKLSKKRSKKHSTKRSEKRSKKRPEKRPRRVIPASTLPEFLDLDVPEQVASPVEPPDPGADGHVGEPKSKSKTRLARPLQPEVFDRDQDQDRDRDQAQGQALREVRALKVSGAVSMTFGLVALGVMAPFAVRDAGYAREYSSLVAKNEAMGGLTLKEDQRVAELDQSSRSTFRSSLALGIAGGVATMLGGSLLIHGHRRALSIAPHADRESVSLSLQGWF